MIHLIVSEFKIDRRRVLIGYAKSPFCRIVKPIGVIVHVREANKCAPFVVPLLSSFDEPPFASAVGVSKVHIASDKVISAAADRIAVIDSGKGVILIDIFNPQRGELKSFLLDIKDSFPRLGIIVIAKSPTVIEFLHVVDTLQRDCRREVESTVNAVVSNVGVNVSFAVILEPVSGRTEEPSLCSVVKVKNIIH